VDLVTTAQHDRPTGRRRLAGGRAHERKGLPAAFCAFASTPDGHQAQGVLVCEEGQRGDGGSCGVRHVLRDDPGDAPDIARTEQLRGDLREAGEPLRQPRRSPAGGGDVLDGDQRTDHLLDVEERRHRHHRPAGVTVPAEHRQLTLPAPAREHLAEDVVEGTVLRLGAQRDVQRSVEQLRHLHVEEVRRRTVRVHHPRRQVDGQGGDGQRRQQLLVGAADHAREGPGVIVHAVILAAVTQSGHDPIGPVRAGEFRSAVRFRRTSRPAPAERRVRCAAGSA
jgi:hypothetical protein